MKTKFFLSLTLLGLMTLVSCELDQIVPEPDGQEPVSFEKEMVVEESFQDTLENIVYASKGSSEPPYTSWIMKASSLKDIPSQRFDIDWKYKSAYQHFKQPDGYSCSWTSCMLSLGAIINAKWGGYNISKDKVYDIKKACKNSNRITALETYIEDNHAIYVDPYRPNIGQNKTYLIKQILNHLYVNRAPFMAIYTYTKMDGKIVGHYVVVHAIDWKKGGKNSTIYYSDPAKKAKSSYKDNLYAMELSDFIDGMLILPDDLRNYNLLFLVPNRY